MITFLASSFRYPLLGISILLGVLTYTPVTFARDASTWKGIAPEGSILVAQDSGDDAIDPFADYSEFEESADEEEDINFFRNGRMLAMGIAVGSRGFTQNLGELYSQNGAYGVFLTYFFDLRFAMNLGFISSEHTLRVKGPTETIEGNVGISDLSITFRYYMNTQNVTKGLAAINPYLFLGFSQIYRTITVRGNSDFAKDGAFGFDGGFGIEIPLLRNKMFFAVQGAFQAINFADEGKSIVQSDEVSTGITPNGDSYTALALIGVNF